jgi:hypothetical protein
MKFRAFGTMEEILSITSDDRMTERGDDTHVITIQGGRIIVQNHDPEFVQQEETFSKLAGDEQQTNCVRIKMQLGLWIAQGQLSF